MLVGFMGVWREIRYKATSISRREGMGIWNWGNTWITTVCPITFFPSVLHCTSRCRKEHIKVISKPLTAHPAFNFSHQINELSFGPYYPSLVNPLDSTIATTLSHFFKFQYYLSVVPTIYTEEAHTIAKLNNPSTSPSDPPAYSSHTIWTNQYAVTSQSHLVGENQVPGIFVKFDIEPITLTIAEEWGGILALLVRLVNVVSGVIVAGGWCYQLYDWGLETWGKRTRRRESNMGVITGRRSGEYDVKSAYD